MDTQIVEMLRDRFDAVDASLKAAKESFDKHAETDAKYWAKIEAQAAQISLMSWLTGTVLSLLLVVGTWLGLHK